MSTATESPFLAAKETCATLAEPPLGFPSNCRAWRSCRSCLQKSGCVLTSSNRCASQSETDLSANYRKAFTLNLTLPNATVSNPQGLAANQSWVFPANEATYCPVDDATCAKCKSESFYRPGGFADSRFCVGAGGCVCVFNCEAIDPLASLGECSAVAAAPTSAPPLNGAEAWLSKQPDSSTTLVYVFVIPIVVLVLASLYCVIRKRNRERDLPPVSPSVRHPTVWRNPRVEINAVTERFFGPSQLHPKAPVDEHGRVAGLPSLQPVGYSQLQTPTTNAPPPPTRSDL